MTLLAIEITKKEQIRLFFNLLNHRATHFWVMPTDKLKLTKEGTSYHHQCPRFRTSMPYWLISDYKGSILKAVIKILKGLD